MKSKSTSQMDANIAKIQTITQNTNRNSSIDSVKLLCLATFTLYIESIIDIFPHKTEPNQIIQTEKPCHSKD